MIVCSGSLWLWLWLLCTISTMSLVIICNYNDNNSTYYVKSLLSRMLGFKREREREKERGERRQVLPNCATWNPQCFVLFLLYLCLYLVSYEHQVGPGVNGVWQQVFVFSLQLQSMFVDILCVLLSDLLSVIPWVFNLETEIENKTVFQAWQVLTSLICLTLLNLINKTIG